LDGAFFRLLASLKALVARRCRPLSGWRSRPQLPLSEPLFPRQEATPAPPPQSAQTNGNKDGCADAMSFDLDFWNTNVYSSFIFTPLNQFSNIFGNIHWWRYAISEVNHTE
jgi:hypothetical protein